jgi:hypothetical protein
MSRTALVALSLLATASAQMVGTLPDKGPRYFPLGVFALGKSDDGDFLARWYAEELRGLKEPSLSENVPAREPVYRFLWLRTFHHAIAVRITIHPNGGGTITVKMADGGGGYPPGKLILDSTREISLPEVRHALDLVDAMDFWRMPPELGPLYPDGAEWIFEASDHGKYHVIDRQSPQDGPVRELGVYLVQVVAKLAVPANEVY